MVCESMFVWQSSQERENKMKVKKAAQFCMKDRFMHMMLHLNEDFDDDLLMDAM